MKNIFKVISIASVLLIAGNALAMKPGKSAGTKRDRAEQAQVDWRDTTLKSVFNNVLFPNTEKLRKKLAANKEDLNQLLTLEQKTLLYYAVIKGNIQNIQLLLEYGANPNVDLGNGVTVLHVACKLGNFEIVRMLLARGANPTNVTKSGKTIRDFANHSGNAEFLQSFNNMLNTKRPKPQVHEVQVQFEQIVPVRVVAQEVPHMVAAAPVHQAEKQAIVPTPADNQKMIEFHKLWKHPLCKIIYEAIEHGNIAYVKHVITPANQAHVNTLVGPEQITLLHKAVLCERTDIAQLLLAKGAAIEAPTANGRTPLHVAAELGRLPMVQFLVEHGASITARTIDGKTPYDLALNTGRGDVVHYLESKQNYGAPTLNDSRRSSRGSTADLMLAAKEAHQILTESEGSDVRELSVAEKRHEIEEVIGAYALINGPDSFNM